MPEYSVCLINSFMHAKSSSSRITSILMNFLSERHYSFVPISTEHFCSIFNFRFALAESGKSNKSQLTSLCNIQGRKCKLRVADWAILMPYQLDLCTIYILLSHIEAIGNASVRSPLYVLCCFFALT